MLKEFTKDRPNTPLLDRIKQPKDLKKLSLEDMEQLANELRLFLTWSIPQSGGHFASSLGCTELSIALHYVFNAPEDKIIWDVGHQAYAHKMLTGRADRLPTIRSLGGLAPFPNIEESPYDAFGVGHSSTSISAALGMALAFKSMGKEQKAVAVIGDGALTAGMAFEALEHGGQAKANLLVILNDNDMSISDNVGAMANYLSKIMLSEEYSTIKQGSKKILSHLPFAWDLAKKTEDHIKNLVIPGQLFEAMGFEYFGPIDGHNLKELIEVLQDVKTKTKPVFLHVRTIKGKGFAQAEQEPIKYHGLGKFEVGEDATVTPNNNKSLSYANVFGIWACDMAAKDEKLHAITPAMREGSDLINFSQLYKNRYHDVAIAEQHALTFAAGLACGGVKPVVAIYSSFLQRAYDQLIHDLAIQKLDILLAVDRAGLVGEDGATHQGVFDLSYLRCVPNIIIMAPSDENELYKMLNTGYKQGGVVAVRYPRGSGRCEPLQKTDEVLTIGKAKIVREGEKIAILAFGDIMRSVEAVAENLNASLVDMRFVKPLDEQVILHMANTHNLIVTIEENVIKGGAGSGVNEFLLAHKIKVDVLNLGIDDNFVEHGAKKDLLKMLQLDSAGIQKRIVNFLN